ncbi:hypothetical protein C8Q80DRAFT_614071 [Daedaleopsis nitida]|nr:hypothetical protein C8Q80DRAFT_614071 [Daedaleopsis nitida]
MLLYILLPASIIPPHPRPTWSPIPNIDHHPPSAKSVHHVVRRTSSQLIPSRIQTPFPHSHDPSTHARILAPLSLVMHVFRLVVAIVAISRLPSHLGVFSPHLDISQQLASLRSLLARLSAVVGVCARELSSGSWPDMPRGSVGARVRQMRTGYAARLASQYHWFTSHFQGQRRHPSRQLWTGGVSISTFKRWNVHERAYAWHVQHTGTRGRDAKVPSRWVRNRGRAGGERLSLGPDSPLAQCGSWGRGGGDTKRYGCRCGHGHGHGACERRCTVAGLRGLPGVGVGVMDMYLYLSGCGLWVVGPSSSYKDV